MNIGFALLPEKGHVNPYIGPAQALEEMGHRVVVAAPGDLRGQVARAGLEFCPDLIRAGDRVTSGRELVELIQDAGRLDRWIEELLLSDIDAHVGRLCEWYRHASIDVAAIDPLYYAAAIAAEQCGIRWAAVSNSLNPVLPKELDSVLLRTVQRLSVRRAAVFRRYGFLPEFSGCDVLSPYLTIVFATSALVGEAPAGVTLAGPSFPLHDRGDEADMRPLPADRPVVYASFGSQVYYWPELFEKLLLAGRAIGAHMVFSMGELAQDPRWSGVTPDTHVYSYAPQLAVLRRAAVFVTHGGANSVMEAAASGVPMLLSPMCNDQFHQAYFVQRSGIGCVENLATATVERIAERIGSLLSDTGMKTAVQRVAAAYQRDGARIAARALAIL